MLIQKYNGAIWPFLHMNRDVSPRGFDQSDVIEKETARVIQNCLRYDQIRVNFETVDKYPNRDGFIEILNEDLIPVGDVVIQVKKIPDHRDSPKKQIKRETLAYGYITNSPFVILGVNTSEERVYWHYASGEWLDSKELGKAESRVVEFERDRVFTGENPVEVNKIRAIAEDESEYLENLETKRWIGRILGHIYELYEDTPFQGAILRRDITETSWDESENVRITPSLLDKLAITTDYLDKVGPGEEAVAIVDTRAKPEERAVASINDSKGVQQIAYQAVHRENTGRLTEHTINWREPSDVVSKVNSTVGMVLDIVVNSRYYRLTDDGVQLAEDFNEN